MFSLFIYLFFSSYILFFPHIYCQILSERFQKAVIRAEKTINIPSLFVPVVGSENHKNVSSAVFSVGLMANIMPRYYKIFFGTLRKTGFEGDIVVAIDESTSQSNIDLCLKFSPVLYKPVIECNKPNETKWKSHDRACRLAGTNDEKISISMMRYRMYLWWASKYEKFTNILIADFRDVFFQSNPFNYIPDQWAQPISQLTVFLEATPQKAIYRCKFNSGWIKGCYGQDALNLVKTNPVSCSGTSIGSRDGILLYSYIMLEQIDENSRSKYGLNGKVPPNEDCHVIGMDQGLHNWLLFSGRLRRVMRVKIFSQGEGPVNTVGAFYNGPQGMFKFDIESDWNILRGPYNERYISNWNGDPSPVVHQLDRFEASIPNLMRNISAVHGVWSP
mmetsp:Transcript_17731/g.18474  ORF Transcript_17731/g.18474 Transcript_17731/m.18474 type:complete len:389 (-) Transcript_17731:44-1210(-)